MAPVWVEGQVVQLNRRPGTSTAFLTLRDTDLDMSLPVSAASRVLQGTPVEEGAHVVVHAKPVFWTRRGTLQLQAREIRPVGVGELLARIEHLKRVLAAEGLFDADRKRPLPFLPAVVGLVCGRESKAEHDVVVNARARWPQVRFEIREVAVQGAHAVQQVGDAIRALDADPEVEVIVVARGGGAVEDLLPFSNEALVRVAAACRTPLVSAIGHETDCPLLDLVADYRASTPTAAAKRVVPDVTEERARVAQGRQRLRSAIAGRVSREQAGLDALRSRPVLAEPGRMLTDRQERVGALRDRARRALDARLVRAAGEVGRLEAQVRALSPASTLERGTPSCSGRTGTWSAPPPTSRRATWCACDSRTARWTRRSPARTTTDPLLAGRRRDAPAPVPDRPPDDRSGHDAQMGLNTAVTSFDNAVTPDVSTLSYEQARDELVQVVARLEAGANRSRTRSRSGSGARSSPRAARSGSTAHAPASTRRARRTRRRHAARPTPTTRPETTHEHQHGPRPPRRRGAHRARPRRRRGARRRRAPRGRQRRGAPRGSLANVALTLGRLGRDARLATWLGQDARGEAVRAWLDDSAVTLTAGSTDAPTTSVATAHLDAHGAATYEFDLEWRVPAGTAPDAGTLAVHTGSIAAVLEPGASDVRALVAAARDTATITYDPNARPALMGDPPTRAPASRRSSRSPTSSR